jgi:hypothetical protein
MHCAVGWYLVTTASRPSVQKKFYEGNIFLEANNSKVANLSKPLPQPTVQELNLMQTNLAAKRNASQQNLSKAKITFFTLSIAALGVGAVFAYTKNQPQ